MPSLEIKNTVLNVEIEYSFPGLRVGNGEVAKLVKALHEMDAVVPISTLVFEQTGNVVGDEHEYSYQIVESGGRHWKQKIYIVSGYISDAPMTFDVTDKWKLSEFRLHRDIRESAINLMSLFGHGEIKVTRL